MDALVRLTSVSLPVSHCALSACNMSNTNRVKEPTNIAVLRLRLWKIVTSSYRLERRLQKHRK